MQLPTLRADIRFSSFDEASSSSGRYLVEAGESCFAVSREMYHLLTLLSEGPSSIETLTARLSERIGQELTTDEVTKLLAGRIPPALRAEHPTARRKTPFLASVRLFSGPTIAPLTSRLTWLYDKRVVIAAMFVFAAIILLTIPAASSAIHSRLTATEIVILYTAIAVIGLIHELGHATASFRYGCEHGDVGFGLYYIFPAFYADVTKAWRLPAKQRAVIDLGGLYFNALTLIPICLFALATDNRIALRIVWITLFVMLQNLNPMFKLDGYWLFSDLSGLTNLHARVSESFRRRTIDATIVGLRRGLLHLYLVAVVIYGLFIVDFLVRSIRGIAETYPARFAQTTSPWQIGVMSLWPLVLAATIVSIAMKLLRTVRAPNTRPDPSTHVRNDNAVLESLRRAARHPRRARKSLRQLDDPLPAEEWRWLLSEKRSPFVLALPFTLPSLAIIGRLFHSRRHFLCIEETPLSAPILQCLAGRHALVAPASTLVRHRRTTAPADLAHVIYITFPDHHSSSVATSRVLRFLDCDHYVPVTESLLYFRGVSPLVTLTTRGLARYEVVPRTPVTEADALALMQWLLGHVEDVVRNGKHELLWRDTLALRTVEAVRLGLQLNRGVEARMVEGFVRTWQKHDDAVDSETLHWSLGELSRIVKEAR